MDIADDDIKLDARVDDLIERGLDRYGRGDMEGALSEWKHALALDPDSERAANYLHYVEEHHDLSGLDDDMHTESTVELAYPFGVAELGLARLREEDLDDYESIEISLEQSARNDAGVSKAEDRSRTVADVVDDGWSVDEGWVQDLVNKSEGAFGSRADTRADVDGRADTELLSKPKRTKARPPTSTDEASFADLELDGTGDEDLEPTRARTASSMVNDVGLSMALDSPASVAGFSDLELEAEGAADDPSTSQPLREELTIPGGTPRRASTHLGTEALDALERGMRREFGGPEESTAERSGASARGFDELELDGLEATNLRPEIPDASDDGTDSGVSISFDDDGPAPETPMDEELTIDRGRSGVVGLMAGTRALTEDSGLLSMNLDESLGSLQDETQELSLPEIEGAHYDKGVPNIELEDEPSGGIDLGLSGDELAALSIGASPTSATTDDVLARVTAEAPRTSSAEQTLFVVGRLIEEAAREFTEGNNADAAVAINYALDYASDSASAQKVIFENERRIIQILISNLGELDEVPRLLVPLHEIPLDQLDNRAAFLLTRVDGSLTLDEVLDVSGMPRMEALRHLCRVHASKFLVVG